MSSLKHSKTTMIEMRRAFQIPKNDKHNFFFKKEDFGEFRTDGFFD